MVGESLERFAPEAARGELVHSTDDHDDLLDATRRDVSTSGRAGVTECCRLRPIPSALRNGRAHNRFQSVFLIAAASDPNWFYSTVAQSTAAIVGLAGGFLAARLVSHRADIASERAPIRTSFLRLAQQIASWNQIASQFSASLMAVIGQAEEQQKRGALGQESVSLTNVSSLRPGGKSMSPGNPPINERQLDLLKDAHEMAERFKESIAKVNDAKSLSQLFKAGEVAIPEEFDTGSVWPMTRADWWAELEDESSSAGVIWSQLSGQVKGLAREREALSSRLIPRSMLLLLVALSALLVVGAVVPMGYLEARGGSSKIYLLSAFAVFSLAVVGVLGYEMISIRRAAELDRETF